MLSTLHVQFISSLATHFHTFEPTHPRRCFQPLALSSFQIRLCSTDPLCNYVPSTPNHLKHRMQSLLPCYVTLAFFAIGSSSHGISVFAHCLAATLIAFDAICSVSLSGSQAGSSLYRHRICVDLSVLICFCDKPYYLSTHLCPIPDLESPAIPLINCDGYLCVPPI